MNREEQLKAIAAIQEQLGKLKAALEAPMPGMPEGRSFQDLSDEERTKMREAMTTRRNEQAKVVSAIEQELSKLKGVGQLRTEQEESIAPLKEILASAQKEQAKETAGKVEQLIAQRQKVWEDKMKSIGLDPTAMPGGGRRGGGAGAGGPSPSAPSSPSPAPKPSGSGAGK
jgi:septal ring factor EnvC (AmiA/AmiB activator)